MREERLGVAREGREGREVGREYQIRIRRQGETGNVREIRGQGWG